MHQGIAELCAVGTSRVAGKSTAFEVPYGAQVQSAYVERLHANLRQTKLLLRSEGERAEHWETEWHKAQRRSVLAHKRAHDNLWIGGVLGMAAGVLFSLGVGLL